MSRFIIGNLYLIGSMSCALGSQVLLKLLINEHQTSVLRWNDLAALLSIPVLVRGGLSIGLLVVGFIFWVLALSRLDLSYAYPVASSTVVFMVVFGALFLGEAVTPRMYLGSVLILTGIILLMPARME